MSGLRLRCAGLMKVMVSRSEITMCVCETESECVDVDMRLYSALLDRIPQQCVSVPLLLHCLIEQVYITALFNFKSNINNKNIIKRFHREMLQVSVCDFCRWFRQSRKHAADWPDVGSQDGAQSRIVI